MTREYRARSTRRAMKARPGKDLSHSRLAASSALAPLPPFAAGG
jgi:hypothetical protein